MRSPHTRTSSTNPLKLFKLNEPDPPRKKFWVAFHASRKYEPVVLILDEYKISSPSECATNKSTEFTL